MAVQPSEVVVTEAERIVYGYRLATRGDAWTALVRALEDALSDLEPCPLSLDHRYRIQRR